MGWSVFSKAVLGICYLKWAIIYFDIMGVSWDIASIMRWNCELWCVHFCINKWIHHLIKVVFFCVQFAFAKKESKNGKNQKTACNRMIE
jgi:hypothetical protein